MSSLPIGIISKMKLVRKALICLLSSLSLGYALSLTVDADNVDDASGQIAASKPQVLIIDCDGAVNCLQCVRSVSALSPLTKSLLLAEEVDEMFAIRAVHSGAWGIVGKQAEPALLQQAIQKLVDGEVWFSNRTIATALHTFTNHDPSTGSAFDRLTARETEVLTLLSRGLCNKEIASQLFLAESTIKAYVKVIFRKLGVNSRLKAALTYTDHIESSVHPIRLPATILIGTDRNIASGFGDPPERPRG
ncbi:MAG: response regulator transcription factor [Acidobacteriota bacterium]